MTALLFILAVLTAVIGLWPFGPYQASLALARRLHRFPPVPRPDGPGPSTFALCVCAYNERTCIEAKIADMLRLREAAGGDLEILVHVDAADDGTTEILRAHEKDIRLVVAPHRRGKTEGMNRLVDMTDAEIVIFTDANVAVGRDTVAVLRRWFADSTVGCVCADLTYVNADESATATVGSAYWRFNEWSKALETDTGSVLGADGALFAIRRSLHRPVPRGMIDDLHVSLSVLLQGARVVRAADLKAREMHATDAHDEFARKARIACECMHVHFDLWPRLRRLDLWHLYKYVGHRLLRWIGGFFLAASGLLTLAALATVVGPG